MNRDANMATRINLFHYCVVFFLAWAETSATSAADFPCAESGDTRIWISPLKPSAEGRIKMMAVSTDGPVSELMLIDSRGRRQSLQSRRRGGPPWSLSAAMDELGAGDYRVVAVRHGKLAACRALTVGGSSRQDRPQAWGLGVEAFYSAWIEALFGAPPEESLGFSSLQPVLRNSERNFLYNYLGRNEDRNLPLTPDCADLPYTLRAYFAWKLGLPFAFRACGRGSAKAPPHCGGAIVKTDFMRGVGSQAVFLKVSRQLADTVHSGSARTALENASTDLYPVPLSRETLWPGTVYADPYGHVLVLAEWVAQTPNRPGKLLAVDAQPDNSVSRKQVWEGTLLFAESKSSGPGFKVFRPLVRTASGGWRALGNDELLDHPGFAPFSLAQEHLTRDDFYARLAKLVNPAGLEPQQAYEAALDALVEQLETRVNALDNGETYLRKHSGKVIPMPSGAAIFQTVGPWEDYSTPSRDMRLLIAIEVVNGLPEKIVRHPDLFVLHGQDPAQAKAAVERRHARRIHERSIRYTRSDGSRWALSVAELLARQKAFEMAYNPNDCVELRWGAKPDSEEYATCRRQAPVQQRAKMRQYRIWFRELRRPAL
ncbi:MAG: hypothetical protein ACU837_12430 [Gammaproteobacteria bacterium]